MKICKYLKIIAKSHDKIRKTLEGTLMTILMTVKLGGGHDGCFVVIQCVLINLSPQQKQKQKKKSRFYFETTK